MPGNCCHIGAPVIRISHHDGETPLSFEDFTCGCATTDRFDDLRDLGHIDPMACDFGPVDVELQIISPAICSARGSTPRTCANTRTMASAFDRNISRSSPNSFTATWGPNPDTSSSTRMAMGWTIHMRYRVLSSRRRTRCNLSFGPGLPFKGFWFVRRTCHQFHSPMGSVPNSLAPQRDHRTRLLGFPTKTVSTSLRSSGRLTQTSAETD